MQQNSRVNIIDVDTLRIIPKDWIFEIPRNTAAYIIRGGSDTLCGLSFWHSEPETTFELPQLDEYGYEFAYPDGNSIPIAYDIYRGGTLPAVINIYLRKTA